MDTQPCDAIHSPITMALQPKMRSSQAQLWERREKLGLLGQRSRGTRNLNAVFQAGDFANRPLPPLPTTPSRDRSESGYSNKVGTGHSDAQSEAASQEHVTTTPPVDAESGSPQQDLLLREQCYRDSCNSHVFNDKHAYKNGPTWHMESSPLYRQDYVPNPVASSAEIRAIIEADPTLDGIPSDGLQVAVKYSQYAYDSAEYPEWERAIDQIDYTQPDSGLTRVRSRLQNGLRLVRRRCSIVKAGMRWRAGSISSV